MVSLRSSGMTTHSNRDEKFLCFTGNLEVSFVDNGVTVMRMRSLSERCLLTAIVLYQSIVLPTQSPIARASRTVTRKETGRYHEEPRSLIKIFIELNYWASLTLLMSLVNLIITMVAPKSFDYHRRSKECRVWLSIGAIEFHDWGEDCTTDC